jgi:hypothetical protein
VWLTSSYACLRSAFSYDWSRGYTGAVQQNLNKVMIHQVQQEEIKPKQKGK